MRGLRIRRRASCGRPMPEMPELRVGEDHQDSRSRCIMNMSAIPTSSIEIIAQPAPRGVEFIDLAEAARRSGWNEGHIKRSCLRWMAAGLARKQRPPEGGKAKWFVREDVDARFS